SRTADEFGAGHKPDVVGVLPRWSSRDDGRRSRVLESLFETKCSKHFCAVWRDGARRSMPKKLAPSGRTARSLARIRLRLPARVSRAAARLRTARGAGPAAGRPR